MTKTCRPKMVYNKLGPGMYAVERLLDKRRVDRKTQYLVSWQGFGSGENCWREKKDLPPYHVKEFESYLHKRVNAGNCKYRKLPPVLLPARSQPERKCKKAKEMPVLEPEPIHWDNRRKSITLNAPPPIKPDPGWHWPLYASGREMPRFRIEPPSPDGSDVDVEDSYDATALAPVVDYSSDPPKLELDHLNPDEETIRNLVDTPADQELKISTESPLPFRPSIGDEDFCLTFNLLGIFNNWTWNIRQHVSNASTINSFGERNPVVPEVGILGETSTSSPVNVESEMDGTSSGVIVYYETPTIEDCPSSPESPKDEILREVISLANENDESGLSPIKTPVNSSPSQEKLGKGGIPTSPVPFDELVESLQNSPDDPDVEVLTTIPSKQRCEKTGFSEIFPPHPAEFRGGDDGYSHVIVMLTQGDAEGIIPEVDILNETPSTSIINPVNLELEFDGTPSGIGAHYEPPAIEDCSFSSEDAEILLEVLSSDEKNVSGLRQNERPVNSLSSRDGKSGIPSPVVPIDERPKFMQDSLDEPDLEVLSVIPSKRRYENTGFSEVFVPHAAEFRGGDDGHSHMMSTQRTFFTYRHPACWCNCHQYNKEVETKVDLSSDGFSEQDGSTYQEDVIHDIGSESEAWEDSGYVAADDLCSDDESSAQTQGIPDPQCPDAPEVSRSLDEEVVTATDNDDVGEQEFAECICFDCAEERGLVPSESFQPTVKCVHPGRTQVFFADGTINIVDKAILEFDGIGNRKLDNIRGVMRTPFDGLIMLCKLHGSQENDLVRTSVAHHLFTEELITHYEGLLMKELALENETEGARAPNGLVAQPESASDVEIIDKSPADIKGEDDEIEIVYSKVPTHGAYEYDSECDPISFGNATTDEDSSD